MKHEVTENMETFKYEKKKKNNNNNKKTNKNEENRECLPIIAGGMLCNVNRHQGRWEKGRDFEVTSTELRWGGQNTVQF